MGRPSDNLIDRELIDQLEVSLNDERPPAADDVERLYAEAGVLLPDTVGRRFEEVAQFHDAIVRNRRAHLTAEIEAAQQRIIARDGTRADLDRRRGEVMGILSSGGALEHYTHLQEEVGRAEATVEGLRQQLEIERARLRQALQNDLHERDTVLDEAIVLFEELSNALYERAGSLTIDATANGPSFEVKIDAQRSKGINSMQIFCFDMMLTTLANRRGMGPGFLIHDSHLFDGVDERQVAKALQLGADHSKAEGFQYIVTLNSDALPEEGFRHGFDICQFTNPTVLTDARETGGLFGIRFA